MSVDSDLLQKKIMGCWLGKAVGGTLGQNFEGLIGPLDAQFYTPVPTEMIPNDDLDLQVLYAVLLSESSDPSVDRIFLGSAWENHVEFPWNEYGVGQRNWAEGIRPPFTGSFDNWFTCGEGAAIRSELWACLAPGKPDLAAQYAFEDACFDHDGDGIYAAQFLARVQSAAFIESDIFKLIDIGLAGIPKDSGIHRVVTDTLKWCETLNDWKVIRQNIMTKYGNSDMTNVMPNTGFVILGLVKGKDFSERICITNNCGEDTDSSTASLGSLLGIIDPTCIDDKWLTPIGNDLVLSKEIKNINSPKTLDDFTQLVIDLGKRLNSKEPKKVVTKFDPKKYEIPVSMTWTNGISYQWAKRDMSELPPVGTRAPIEDLKLEKTSIPGTWMKIPFEECKDRILYVRYTINARNRENVRLMINTNVEFRSWLDGEPFMVSLGSPGLFPAPHSPQAGHGKDFQLSHGDHDLLVAFRRPINGDKWLEWIIALVEMPSAKWIENAFRPQPINQPKE